MSDYDEDDSSSALDRTIDDSGIHYIYQEDLDDQDQDSQDGLVEEASSEHAQQYQILTPSEMTSESSDVPSVRAILIDGQYYLTDGDQTLLFQDGGGDDPLNQYYVSENSGYAEAIDDRTEDESSTQFVQLVEDPNEDSNQHQIIYYADTSLDVEDSNSQPPKKIKLEGHQMVDLEELLQQQQEEDGEENVHYAVMEDGSIHKITNVEEADIEAGMEAEIEAGIEAEIEAKIENLIEEEQLEMDEESMVEVPELGEVVDPSQITGTNLMTGQRVTLHSYMEKLQKKMQQYQHLPIPPLVGIKRRSEDGNRNENSLLNKKISIGKTRTGKKIVGKIIKVDKKKTEENPLPMPLTEDEEEEEEVEEVLGLEGTEQEEQAVRNKTKVLVKRTPVSKDTFEQISKTLAGVMEMVSVRKKLEEKNIVVRLVEKKYVAETGSSSKSSSYSYGYMEKDYEENGEEKWRFVPDQNTHDAILKQFEDLPDEERAAEEKTVKKSMKYELTTSLTILITHGQAGNKTIRVNLNPSPGNLCTVCANYFEDSAQLKVHMKRVHNTPKILKCEVCAVECDDLQSFDEHKMLHVKEGRLFICTECNKCFTTHARLQKHLPTHDPFRSSLECPVCSLRLSSEPAVKKHFLTHLKHPTDKGSVCGICHKHFSSVQEMNYHRKVHYAHRNFVCNVCLRTFSRHSNLMRHMEIHKGEKSLYKCEVCYCSYNFASSLTRHIVQNHINVGDFRKNPNKTEGTTSA